MTRRQKSREAATDRRSAAAASGASSGLAPVTLGGVRLAQADPEVGAMAEQLAAATLGTRQPDEPLRERSLDALCLSLANATDAGAAADTLRVCLAKAHEDARNAEKLFNCGAVNTALACMRRFRSSEDVQRAALEFFNHLFFGAVGWDRLVQALRREGVESVAADLIAAAHPVSGGFGMSVLGNFMQLMPELGPIVARDTPLLNKALRLAGGSEEGPPMGALQLLVGLVKCPEGSPLDAVAALPGLVPTLLTTLRKAHTAGCSGDVFWTLQVLTAGSEDGDKRIAGAVGAVADDATLKLILCLASDADDTVAMNASVLCYQINMHHYTQECPLTRCSNAVPALVAAIRSTGPQSPPSMERDQAACFAIGVLTKVVVDLLTDTTPDVSSVARLLAAAASDVTERIAHLWEQEMITALGSIATAGPLLGFVIDACLVAGRPGQLTAIPCALAAAARAVTYETARGGDDAEMARSTYSASLSRMLHFASRLTDALHAAQGAPWTLAQLEDLQAGVLAVQRVLEACQGPGRGREMTDKQQHMDEQRRMMQQLDGLVRRARQQQRQRGEAAGQRAAAQQQQQPHEPQPQQQQRSAPGAAPAAAAAPPATPSAAAAAQCTQAAAGQVAANASSSAGPAHTCAHCGAAAAPGGPKLLRCAGCREVRYCGEACAAAAWKGHKRACRAAQTAMAAAAVGEPMAGAQQATES